jgi:hypothetical protein
VYDAFARSFKRLRVVITIDLRFFAKKKLRVDVQNRVSSEIAFDSNFVEKMKKNEKKKNRDEKNREEERKRRKKNENDEINDDDEKNDDIDVQIVQIAVNK